MDDRAPERFIYESHAEDLTDGEFARDVLIGVGLGMPIVGAMAWLVMALAAGTSHGTDLLAAALWAGLVGGGFIGGLVVFGRALGRMEAADAASRRTLADEWRRLHPPPSA